MMVEDRCPQLKGRGVCCFCVLVQTLVFEEVCIVGRSVHKGSLYGMEYFILDVRMDIEMCISPAHTYISAHS